MRPDIPNEISCGDLDERIDFPKCNVFQVHQPKYFIFWDQRISVILMETVGQSRLIYRFSQVFSCFLSAAYRNSP